MHQDLRRRSLARLAALLAPLALVAVLSACGGDGAKGPATTPEPGSPAASPTVRGVTRCDLDLAAEAPDATIYGAEAGDFLADRFALAAADFNDDGAQDILAGAPLADGPDNGRTNAGEAYIVFGGAGLADAVDLAAAAGPDLTVYGSTPGGNLGFTVAAGDVNGDGIADALLGARFAGPGTQPQSGEGQAYVVFGRADLGGGVDVASSQQDVTVTGGRRGDYLSIALASGDVNGDEISDLILGASGASGPDNARGQAGEAYVILGAGDLPDTIDLTVQEPYLTVFGARAADLMPNYLAAGDLDGDGKDEIIAGAPAAGRAAADALPAGEAYIIDVPDSPGAEIDLAEAGGYTRLRGASPLDGLGFFVAAADLDDDGKDDAIISARDADGPDDSRNNAGEVYVLMGKDDLPPLVDLATSKPDVTVFGGELNASFGFTVAAGDINGDGRQDLLAGAPVGDGCDGRAEDTGQAYVVFGQDGWPDTIDLVNPEFDFSVFGAEAADELGFSLVAGDVNGDGKDDIIAGALQADGPDNSRADTGEAYVILSR